MYQEIIKYNKKIEKINKNYKNILFNKNKSLDEQKDAYKMIMLINNFHEFLAEFWLIILEYGVENNKLIDDMQDHFVNIQEQIHEIEKDLLKKDSCFY